MPRKFRKCCKRAIGCTITLAFFSVSTFHPPLSRCSLTLPLFSLTHTLPTRSIFHTVITPCTINNFRKFINAHYNHQVVSLDCFASRRLLGSHCSPASWGSEWKTNHWKGSVDGHNYRGELIYAWIFDRGVDTVLFLCKFIKWLSVIL